MPETDIATATDTAIDADAATGTQLDLDRRVEALLIVADRPRSLMELATALEAPLPQVKAAVESLVADYDGADAASAAPGVRRAFELREIAGGWRLYVRAEHDVDVAALVAAETPARLSQAALETLAVIAYRQPISRGAIGAVRAVNVDSVVRTLVQRGLVAETGQDPDTGAILYGTTELLLEHLGIATIDDLPLISPMLPGDADDGDA